MVNLFTITVVKECTVCEQFPNKSNLNRHSKRFPCENTENRMTQSKKKQVIVSHKKTSRDTIDIKMLNKVLKLLYKHLIQRKK